MFNFTPVAHQSSGRSIGPREITIRSGHGENSLDVIAADRVTSYSTADQLRQLDNDALAEMYTRVGGTQNLFDAALLASASAGAVEGINALSLTVRQAIARLTPAAGVVTAVEVASAINQRQLDMIDAILEERGFTREQREDLLPSFRETFSFTEDSISQNFLAVPQSLINGDDGQINGLSVDDLQQLVGRTCSYS